MSSFSRANYQIQLAISLNDVMEMETQTSGHQTALNEPPDEVVQRSAFSTAQLLSLPACGE